MVQQKYPASLSNFCTKISNYSRNIFRLIPYRSDGINPSQIIVCDLPSNALVDLDTLCLHFNLTTTTTAGFAAPSKHIETLIDKVVVEINGQTLGSCSSLNHVYDLLLQYQNGADLKAKRTLYQNGGAQVAPTANQTSVPYAVHNFLGFVSSAQPSVLDTALLGNVRIHIYLAPATVLMISAAGAGVSYQLNNVYYSVDTISIDDGIFYNLHNEFLMNGGTYEIPFQSIYTALFSTATQTQSSRFSINTQSLDMLGACFLPNHGTQSQIGAVSKESLYFQKKGDNLTAWQFEVNGVSMPQFQAGVDDAFPLALNALCLSQDLLGGVDSDIASAAAYKTDFFAPIIRLNHPSSDQERAISGLNTIGNSASIVYKTTSSTNTASQLLIVAFCTSLLLCSAGRTISIVN